MAAFAMTVLLAFFAVVIVYWLCRYIRMKILLDKVYGPRTYPFIGNINVLQLDPNDFWDQLIGICMHWVGYPHMIRFWLMWAPYLIIYGADEAEVILSSNKHIGKSHDYTFLQPWMGMGLLTSSAEKWRPRRKLLTPTFHYDILKDFMYTFNEQARIIVKKLEKVVGIEEFNVYPYITLCALDIICQSSMGRHVNAQLNEDSDYVKAIYKYVQAGGRAKLNNLIHDRQKKPWFWMDFLYDMFGEGKTHTRCLNIVHSFTKSVIDERYKERLAGHTFSYSEGKKRLAFLDLLLEMVDKGALTLQDVREEVDTFMFEGHDTTTAGMNWTLYLLGSYPEIQEKVHQELDSVFGDDTDDRDIQFEDLKRLNFLEMCIKEALRLYPSVPMFARVLAEDCQIVGYTIPASTQVIFVPYAVHRDPAHWPDPETFDPNRFLPENTVGRHPFAYLPFSAGSRNCIGQRFALMEEKTVLAWILRYYRVKSCKKRYQIRPKAELILRPSEGLLLELTLRRTPLQD